MKKVFLLAAAAFIMSGVAFASGDGKKCAKGKECHKDGKEMKCDMKGKDGKEMKECCKKTDEAKKKETKAPKA